MARQLFPVFVITMLFRTAAFSQQIEAPLTVQQVTKTERLEELHLSIAARKGFPGHPLPSFYYLGVNVDEPPKSETIGQVILSTVSEEAGETALFKVAVLACKEEVARIRRMLEQPGARPVLHLSGCAGTDHWLPCSERKAGSSPCRSLMPPQRGKAVPLDRLIGKAEGSTQ